MLVSKSKAAKLAGVSRTTIHRYTSNGKLSMSGDMIDTAELLRVFGQIRVQGDTGTVDVQNGQAVTPEVHAMYTKQISTLEGIVEDLRADRDHWRNLLTHNPTPARPDSNLTLILSVAALVVGIGALVLVAVMVR